LAEGHLDPGAAGTTRAANATGAASTTGAANTTGAADTTGAANPTSTTGAASTTSTTGAASAASTASTAGAAFTTTRAALGALIDLMNRLRQHAPALGAAYGARQVCALCATILRPALVFVELRLARHQEEAAGGCDECGEPL
jgi:hypothetical protein